MCIKTTYIVRWLDGNVKQERVFTSRKRAEDFYDKFRFQLICIQLILREEGVLRG